LFQFTYLFNLKWDAPTHPLFSISIMMKLMEARFIQFLQYKNWFYYFIKYFIFNYIRLFWGLKVIGLENIPRSGGLVIAANHISSADPPVLGICIPRIISYLAKKELFEKLGMRLFITSLYAFPIDRSRADMSAMREAIRRIKSGGAVGVFIQGTRNSGDAEAMNGASFMAQRGDAPILPAAIRRQGKSYTILFGEVLYAEDKSKESMQQLTDKTMEHIQQLIDDNAELTS